jgi:hypothetical protein
MVNKISSTLGFRNLSATECIYPKGSATRYVQFPLRRKNGYRVMPKEQHTDPSDQLIRTSSSRATFAVLLSVVFLDNLGYAIIFPYVFFYASSLGASAFAYGCCCPLAVLYRSFLRPW